MRKLKLIIIFLFWGGQAVWCQTNTCVKQIKDWYNLLETKLEAVNKKQLFEMKFTMELVYLNREKLDSINYDAHVISDRSKKYFFGNEAKIFQDEKTTASISIKHREIHLFDTPPEEYNSVATKQYALFEDTLLSVVDYANVSENEVTLFFKKDNPIANGVREISFDFSGNQLVKSIETTYYPNHPYSRIRVNYHSIDFNSQTTLLDKKLMANIMRGKKLNPEYKNYMLYDHRKNN